jgi:N-acetylglucosamine-6-phosphate deacetylase
MTTITKAYVGAQIFDGQALHKDHALVVERGGVFSVQPQQGLPAGCPITQLSGGVITPRFVDLQVNGGGGVMFNDDQSVAALRTIAQAHATTGTGAILPTLITDTPARTCAAIDAVVAAIAEKVDGIIGIHLEGPHLSVARKGAHDPALIRPMDDADLRLLLDAADRIANVMVTLAPENVTLAQISQLSDAGIVVSLGHTNADVDRCHAAFDAGARCVTHLFNAMSQLESRAPGLVGATLTRGDIYAGLIADAVHVHPTTMRIGLAAKPHSDRVFLVTDAMATAGSDIETFTLNGRDVYRRGGQLTLGDGTLAGADLSMPRAIDVMIARVGDDIAQALARATSTPAQLLRDPGTVGQLSGCKGLAIHTRRDVKTGHDVVRSLG